MGQPKGDTGHRQDTRDGVPLPSKDDLAAILAAGRIRFQAEAAKVLFSVAIIVMSVCGAMGADVTEREPEGMPVSISPATSVDTLRLATPITPWIHKSMPEPTRERLEAGFRLAVERVVEVEACGDLFARLGANGLDMLQASLYFPVDSYLREIEACGRDPKSNSRVAEIFAYTIPGGRAIWVCRNFANISTEEAAVAVIHEALHLAGLREQPIERLSMTSVEITEMIDMACFSDL